MKANILPTDRLYYQTREEKCSRCGREFREDEVPLRLWFECDPNFMYAYCEKCMEKVLSS